MRSRLPRRSATFLTVMVGGPGVLWACTVYAQDGPAVRSVPNDFDAPVKVGRVHENLRRSTEWHGLQSGQEGLYGDYSRRKTRIQQKTGLQWSLDASLLQQWGGPGGGSPSLQLLAGLSLSYDLFHDDAFGAGSIQFSSIVVAYPTEQDGADIGSNLGVISAINDWTLSQSQFERFTYTQTFPGDRLAISIGQFSFGDFDGNRYLGNQQTSFVNDVLAQNGSATYALAGLGTYVQLSPTKTVQFALGLQYPNSASVSTLSFPGIGIGERDWFAYAQWTPDFTGLGPAQYSLTYYESPAVGQQPATRGWSLNAAQDLDETWALFGRANYASGYTTAIRASYAVGLAMNDPLGRSPTDQIGLAVGYSDPAGLPIVPAHARGEKIIETYWNWTLFGGLLMAPDLQLILDPALDPGRDSVWVLSLRATLMF